MRAYVLKAQVLQEVLRIQMTVNKLNNLEANKEEKLPSGVLPNSQNKLESIREQLGKSATNSQAQEAQGSSAGEAHRLMALYLSGKLSAQQLGFKLRVHNSVVAETLIKQSKQDATKALDMREVPRANMANPGAGPNADSRDRPAPKTAAEAKAQARDCEDESKKQKLERQQKKIEQQQQQRVINISNLFEREAQDIKGAHQWRELQRKEKETQEELINQESSQEEAQQYLSRQSKRQSLLNRARLYVGKLLERLKNMVQGGASHQGR